MRYGKAYCFLKGECKLSRSPQKNKNCQKKKGNARSASYDGGTDYQKEQKEQKEKLNDKLDIVPLYEDPFAKQQNKNNNTNNISDDESDSDSDSESISDDI